jgi:hypothetical protein
MDFPEALVPLFGIIFSFGIPGIIIFWWLYTRHRERMRLIEKGLTPEEVKSYFKHEARRGTPFSTLKWGILLAFVGLGIFLANLFEELYEISEGVMTGMIIFSAGLGFIVYFLIASSQAKEDKNEKDAAYSNKQIND